MSPPQQQQIVEERKCTYPLFGKAIEKQTKKANKSNWKTCKKNKLKPKYLWFFLKRIINKSFISERTLNPELMTEPEKVRGQDEKIGR